MRRYLKMNTLLNFNIGILGHVDSGKTSLAKALSTIASTAAFDKNPQSQTRGITIDLGFSSFIVDSPDHIVNGGFTEMQFTLVDCPGHASLIRTIIGGAQIIDAMILVVDVIKGMQTQTAECLVIGEILCKNMLVVLNKIDLIEKQKQKSVIEKMSKKIQNTLKNTKFSNAKVVAISANPSEDSPIGIENLISSLKEMSYVPERLEDNPLVLSVDHCFGIKGQGTVITGTVLQGAVSVNDTIEIASLKMTKKVKSIQMFRRPVKKAIQGDRIGVCVTQFDPKLLERNIVGAPGYIQCASGFIGVVYKINYYKQPICSKTKFHISLGHDTVMCNVKFFGTDSVIDDSDISHFDFDKEYPFQDELIDLKNIDLDAQYRPVRQFVLVEFERTVPIREHAAFIASKLDMDVHTNMCRLAFWGRIVLPLLDDYKKEVLPKLRVFKDKAKEGQVDRMSSETELIVKNLLKKGTDISIFSGLRVTLSSGESGIIDGSFGRGGKIKLRLTDDLKPETLVNLKKQIEKRKRRKDKENESDSKDFSQILVYLKFKTYVFSPTKKIIQTKI